MPSLPLAVTRPTRQKTVSVKYKDFTNLPGHPQSSSAGSETGGTPSSSLYVYHIQNFMSYHVLTPKYTRFLAATAGVPVPSTFKQAACDANWLNAMKLKIHAMEYNKLGTSSQASK